METKRYSQLNGLIFTDNSRSSVALDMAGIGHQFRELREPGGLHVPKFDFKHNFKHDTKTSEPKSGLSPGITAPRSSHDMLPANILPQSDPVNHVSNTDHASLRESTQATIPTPSGGSSPSLGAKSMAVTVSTGSASLSPRSSDTSEVLELEKGVFAAPRLALELRDRSAWDKIQPRLQDTIDNTLRTRQGLESTISCEFMMGGQNPRQLKPTVFLVCCHEAYRKQLRAILKRQKWMREYGYQCVVIVDAFEELSFGSLDVTPGADSIDIQASFFDKTISLCGVQARAQARPADEPVRFTMGGVLLIDNKAFGLTVGHVVEKAIMPQDETSDDDNEDDSESSPFITFDEEEDTVKMTGFSSPEKHAPALELQELTDSDKSTNRNNTNSGLKDGGEWSHFGYFHASTSIPSTTSHAQLDWSLISLEPQLEGLRHPLINSFETPSGDRVSINKFLQRSAIIGSEVWINSGSTGVVRGWLMESPVLLHQNGKTFHVLQVISDQALAPGDSGSWVMMADVLCGHVLSSRKSVPWLYVLPIFDILAEVKTTMGCQDVTLPQSGCHLGGNVLNDSIRYLYHWYDRLGILKRALHESSATHNLTQLQNDCRSTMQCDNLRIALLLGALVLCLSVGQMVLSSIQLSRSSIHLDFVAFNEKANNSVFCWNSSQNF